MKFIKSEDFKRGSNDLAQRIVSELGQGKRVLWILTGGSSIPSSVVALQMVKDAQIDLKSLTVTLSDERYGDVGHADSSWQKLLDSGFDFESVKSIPVIAGLSFDETAREWARKVGDAFASHDIIIAQFGVGEDLHIAGILPGSPAATDTGLVSYYKSGSFDRITLTFQAMKLIHAAYVFIFGEAKRDAVKELRTSTDPLLMKPANVLKSISEVYVYSDQI